MTPSVKKGGVEFQATLERQKNYKAIREQEKTMI